MTIIDILISQLSFWLTYLVTGTLATICSLVYLGNDEGNEISNESTENDDRQIAEISESLPELTNLLNDILSKLSEVAYEEGSDYDLAYEEALNNLEKYLDDDGCLIDTISSSILKELISQFEGVNDNAKEI